MGNWQFEEEATTCTWVLDTTLPSAPEISGIIAGDFNTDQTYTLSGEAESSIEYSIDDGTTWVAGTEITLSDEGVYNVSVRQTDSAGNLSAASAAIEVEIDKTAPLVDAGINQIVNALVTQIATVSDDGGSGLASYLWTNETPAVGIISFIDDAVQNPDISADTDGLYTIRLTVTDNAGNEASDEITFQWNTVNPTVLAGID